jgi:hypothetical protein
MAIIGKITVVTKWNPYAFVLTLSLRFQMLPEFTKKLITALVCGGLMVTLPPILCPPEGLAGETVYLSSFFVLFFFLNISFFLVIINIRHHTFIHPHTETRGTENRSNIKQQQQIFETALSFAGIPWLSFGMTNLVGT